MAEKRKLPPRDRRSSAVKRRISEAASPAASTPAKKKSATPVQPPPAPSEPPEINLPTKLKDGQPLPTLPKPQPFGLPAQEYQSYVESGVVAAALYRSRTKWLQNSIFEKYWVKPTKKKGQPQSTFQNPPRESMTKLGPCTIVIEPHHFDAVMYAVRDPRSRPIHAQQANRPIVQYTHPTNPSNFYQYQPRGPVNQPRNITPYPPNSNAPPPPPNPPPNTHTHPPAQPPPENYEQPNQKAPMPPAFPPAQVPAHIATPPTPAPEQAPRPSLDPVIQMLAARAASNPDLKALMRVVASTKANQEQLRAFQAHIDELNAIIASRQGEQTQQDKKQNQHGQNHYQSPPMTPGPTAPTSSSPGQGIANTHSGAPTSGPPPPQQAPQSNPPPTMYPRPPQPQPPPIRSKNPQQGPSPIPYFQHQPHAPMSKPQEIKAVVFEFVPPAGSTPAVHGATGDRYLFPVNTILDYFPGRVSVIASFLATKKFDPSAPLSESSGNPATGKTKGKKGKAASNLGTPAAEDAPTQTSGQQAESKSTDAEKSDPTPKTNPNIKEYYQPVTMRLFGDAKVLEPLARVVRPAEQVREYMNDIMDRMERADIEYLAMRLPREKPRTDENLADEGPGSKTPRGNGNNNNTGKARAKDAVSNIPTPVNIEEEQELKDFYDLPSGLVPLR